MADINTKKCDRCGRLKGETNHWWIIEYNLETKSMYILPLEFHEVYELWTVSVVACGLECLNILENKIKEGINPLK